MEERTEVACANCGARKFLPGDALRATETALRAFGWSDVEQQHPGRNVVWMRCYDCTMKAVQS